MRGLLDVPIPAQLQPKSRRRIPASRIWFVCLLIANLIVSGALAAKSATPLTFANAVAFFEAVKFRATDPGDASSFLAIELYWRIIFK
jgi:hypothetical protein